MFMAFISLPLAFAVRLQCRIREHLGLVWEEGMKWNGKE